MFVNSSFNNSAYAFDNYGTNLKQQREQRNTTANRSNEDAHKTVASSKDRTTYGTVALRLMSDKEYSSFDRATEYLHAYEKKNFAESVDKFTNDYLESKDVLNGKSMSELLHDKEDNISHLQEEYNTYGGMEGVLDNALRTIKSIVGGDNQSIINFIQKFQATMSVQKLDLTA
jgi:hypothetical protein